MCIITIIDQAGPVLGSVSMLPHWIQPATHPRTPRLPVRGSQILGCISVTMELIKMAHRGAISLDLRWGPGTFVFNKHPVIAMQMSKDHNSLSKWDHCGAPAWPSELVASLWTLSISQSINASEPTIPSDSPFSHPSTTGHFSAAAPSFSPSLTNLPSVPLKGPTVR